MRKGTIINYKVIGIILGALTLIGALIYMSIQKELSLYKTFAKEGYILNDSKSSNNQIDPYRFKEGAKYKVKYPDNIVFSNSDNEKISIPNTNFVHYKDNSISALKNGVLIDADKLSDDPIVYYNVFANSVLNYKNGKYTISNLNKELEFNRIIWKISDSKYLIASNEIKLNLDPTSPQVVSGYVVLEFISEGVAKVYNQSATYKTISSTASIDLGNNVVINLSNKSVKLNDTTALNLAQMVIDAKDNVEIIPEEETELANEDSTSENSSQQGTTTPNTTTNNSIDNVTQDEISDLTPVFNVTSMDVSSIKLSAKIEVKDPGPKISSQIVTKIIENSSGKTVHYQEESSSTYNILIENSNLKPDTEYTLLSTATYKIDDVEYTRDFISKIFKTEVIGINLKKDYFTDSSLNFIAKVDSYSKLKSFQVFLKVGDSKSEPIKTLNFKITDVNIQEYEVKFDELASNVPLSANTEYIVQVGNFLYDGAIISNGFEITEKYKTLKVKPNYTEWIPKYTIDKVKGTFNLDVSNIKDANNGIINYRYELYDNRKINEENQVTSDPETYVNQSRLSTAEVKVDEDKVKRGDTYRFKVVAEFNDNEKIIEYSSILSGTFSMAGVGFPTIKFNTTNVTFERIEGTIVIDDPLNTISRSADNKVVVYYENSVGQKLSFISMGSLSIPVTLNDLRASETYVFSVYTTVDLKDQNPIIDQCFLGNLVVKTKDTQPFGAKFNELTDPAHAFAVSFSLGIPDSSPNTNNTLEATTLTGLTFELYTGQLTQTSTQSPIRTITKLDSQLSAYQSELKNNYYDNSVILTPEFFGMKSTDLMDSYYTIRVVNAYDYTSYKNNIPITDNVKTVKKTSAFPPLPEDYNDALDVTPIRNKDVDGTHGATYRADLNGDTIVGYKIKPRYDNSELKTKTINYRVYDSDTTLELQDYYRKVTLPSDGTINYEYYWLDDGIKYDAALDNKMRRGNRYYFTFDTELDLTGDGEIDSYYPSNLGVGIVLRSTLQTPNRQGAIFQTYLSSASPTTGNATFKYKYTDIDNALAFSRIIPWVGSTQKSPVSIVTVNTDTQYNTITFTGLGSAANTLSLCVQEALSTHVDPPAQVVMNRMILYTPLFASNNISGINYKVSLDADANDELDNKVTIELLDYENKKAKIDTITALKVKFDSGATTKTIDNVPLNINMAYIDFYSIKEFVGLDVTITISAYYDNGNTGFELTGPKYSFIKYDSSGVTNPNYVNFVDSSHVSEQAVARDIMYTTTFNSSSNVLPMTNIVKGISQNLSVAIDKSGLYVYTVDKGVTTKEYYCLLKGISESTLTNSEPGTFNLTTIIPSIDLWKNGTINASALLQEVTLTGKIENIVNGVTIQGSNGGAVYFEIYQKNKTTGIWEFSKNVESNVDNFLVTGAKPNGGSITITGLEPKSSYYTNVYIYIMEAGVPKKHYLYDIFYQQIGYQYYFNTLTNVGISNVSVQYVPDLTSPNPYVNKNIVVNYKLGYTLGYSKITYTVYSLKTYTKTDNTTQVVREKMDLNIPNDVTPQTTMTKKIPCAPGSLFNFGYEYPGNTPGYLPPGDPLEYKLGYTQEYEIEIKPIAVITVNQVETDLELGTVTHKFKLDELITPFIGISSVATDATTLKFRVSVGDISKVVVNGVYSVSFKDESGNTVATVFDGIEYPIANLNQEFQLNGLNSNTRYTMTVTLNADIPNKADPLRYTKIEKQYSASTPNAFNVEIGDVRTSPNNTDRKKIDILFYDTYRLNTIKTIRYSIYSLNGYAASSSMDFTPVLISGQNYYITLPNVLPIYDVYYVEAQFLIDGQVVKTISLTHTYSS